MRWTGRDRDSGSTPVRLKMKRQEGVPPAHLPFAPEESPCGHTQLQAIHHLGSPEGTSQVCLYASQALWNSENVSYWQSLRPLFQVVLLHSCLQWWDDYPTKWLHVLRPLTTWGGVSPCPPVPGGDTTTTFACWTDRLKSHIARWHCTGGDAQRSVAASNEPGKWVGRGCGEQPHLGWR